MALSKTRICEQCKIATPFEELKLLPKDQNNYLMLCKECCEQLKKRAKSKEGAPIQSSSPKMATAKKEAAAQQKPSTKDDLVCLRCNYRFKADLNKAGVSYNLKCPYCGKDDQIRMRKGLLL